jgi:hypothetical protein
MTQDLEVGRPKGEPLDVIGEEDDAPPKTAAQVYAAVQTDFKAVTTRVSDLEQRLSKLEAENATLKSDHSRSTSSFLPSSPHVGVNASSDAVCVPGAPTDGQPTSPRRVAVSFSSVSSPVHSGVICAEVITSEPPSLTVDSDEEEDRGSAQQATTCSV